MCLILGGLAADSSVRRRRNEFLVDKYLYKDRYDYRQIINSLSTSLNSCEDTVRHIAPYGRHDRADIEFSRRRLSS